MKLELTVAFSLMFGGLASAVEFSILKSITQDAKPSGATEYNLIVHGLKGKFLSSFVVKNDEPQIKSIIAKNNEVKPVIITKMSSSIILVFSSTEIEGGRISPDNFEVVEVKYSIRDQGLVAERIKMTPGLMRDVVVAQLSKLDEVEALEKATKKQKK